MFFCALSAWSQSDKKLEDKLFTEDQTSEPAAGSDQDLSSTSEVVPSDDSREEDSSANTQREESAESEKLEAAIKGPRQVPFEHILVVQNRYVKKEGRHEITPLMAAIQPGDSFRRQLQWGFSYAYHLTEDWGLEALHVNFVSNLKTGLSDSIRSSTTLETYREEPVYSVGSSILWTPLHSKAATDESIYHFEGYFILGGGMTKYENTRGGLAMGGIGFRAYMSKRAIFKTELRDYLDFIGGTQQRLNLLLGVSVLLGGES